WCVEGFDPFVLEGIASHHIAAGTLGILASLFYLSARPADVEEPADELWLGVKCHSNPKLVGSP
ncbi:Photosystem II CP47 reaction center protein, partial [Linum perenne]